MRSRFRIADLADRTDCWPVQCFQIREPRNIEQRMMGEHAHEKRTTYVWARRFGLRTEEYRRTIFFSTPSRRTIVNSPRAFESSNLILLYAFNMFATMRHICVTLLITHIRVQVNYQLFIYQLLIIHIINCNVDYSYMCFICVQVNVWHT